MTDVPPLRFQELAMKCPWCRAEPRDLCHGKGHRARNRDRRDTTHEARRTAWVTAVAVCPTCQVAPGTPCRDANAMPLDQPHPARDAEAVRTQPPARRPRIEALGHQLDITKEH